MDDEAPRIRSLSRRRAPRVSSAVVFGTPEDREAAGEYLAQRMLLPGSNSEEEFSQAVDAELNAMSPSDRVWLEIEMAQSARIGHSFDYDASPWRR